MTPDERRVLLRVLAEDPGYDHDRDIGRELDFKFETKDVPHILVLEVGVVEETHPRNLLARTAIARRDLTVHDGYEDAMRAVIARSADENF